MITRNFYWKILEAMLPRKKFLQHAWANKSAVGSWYETNKRDLNNVEYQNYIRNIGEVLSQKFSLCIDLGCGTFTVINYLRKFYPMAFYFGVDFSDYGKRVYRNFNQADKKKVFFCKEDIAKFGKWSNVLASLKLGAKNTVVITYGTLMYLSSMELERLYKNLRSLDIKKIVSIEPAGELNLETITSIKNKGGFLHNYKSYLEKAKYKLLEYAYLFGRSYIFYVAKPV